MGEPRAESRTVYHLLYEGRCSETKPKRGIPLRMTQGTKISVLMYNPGCFLLLIFFPIDIHFLGLIVLYLKPKNNK